MTTNLEVLGLIFLILLALGITYGIGATAIGWAVENFFLCYLY